MEREGLIPALIRLLACGEPSYIGPLRNRKERVQLGDLWPFLRKAHRAKRTAIRAPHRSWSFDLAADATRLNRSGETRGKLRSFGKNAQDARGRQPQIFEFRLRHLLNAPDNKIAQLVQFIIL